MNYERREFKNHRHALRDMGRRLININRHSDALGEILEKSGAASDNIFVVDPRWVNRPNNYLEFIWNPCPCGALDIGVEAKFVPLENYVNRRYSRRQYANVYYRAER